MTHRLCASLHVYEFASLLLRERSTHRVRESNQKSDLVHIRLYGWLLSFSVFLTCLCRPAREWKKQQSGNVCVFVWFLVWLRSKFYHSFVYLAFSRSFLSLLRFYLTYLAGITLFEAQRILLTQVKHLENSVKLPSDIKYYRVRHICKLTYIQTCRALHIWYI